MLISYAWTMRKVEPWSRPLPPAAPVTARVNKKTKGKKPLIAIAVAALAALGASIWVESQTEYATICGDTRTGLRAPDTSCAADYNQYFAKKVILAKAPLIETWTPKVGEQLPENLAPTTPKTWWGGSYTVTPLQFSAASQPE